MAISRHYIESLSRWEQRLYSTEPAGPQLNDRGREGYIRLKTSSCSDFFRSRVTLILNPDHPQDIPPELCTFNRGSLIKFLNEQIDHRHTLRERHLNSGWFGGWIGGSSERNIQNVYNEVLHYRNMRENALNIERPIAKENWQEAQLSKAPVQKIQESLAQQYPEACKLESLNKDAEISLYRIEQIYDAENAQTPEKRYTVCAMEITVKAANFDISALMEAIKASEHFKGTQYPILISNIYVQYANPQETLVNEQDPADLLVANIQHWQKDWGLCCLRGAEVQTIETFPPENPLLEIPFNENDATLFLYSAVDEENQNLYIDIKNPEIDINALLNFTTTLRGLGLDTKVAISYINIFLHPDHFPENIEEVAKDFIERIYKWQIENREVAYRDRRSLLLREFPSQPEEQIKAFLSIADVQSHEGPLSNFYDYFHGNDASLLFFFPNHENSLLYGAEPSPFHLVLKIHNQKIDIETLMDRISKEQLPGFGSHFEISKIAIYLESKNPPENTEEARDTLIEKIREWQVVERRARAIPKRI